MTHPIIEDASGRLTREIDGWIFPVRILKVHTTVPVGAARKFVVKEHFQGNSGTGPRIFALHEGFCDVMMNKIEENVPASILTFWTPEQACLKDKNILPDFGDRAQTFLAHLWELLSKQPNGEEGALLVKGAQNVFYVMGTDNRRWAVHLHWETSGDSGWVIRADCENQCEWRSQDQIISSGGFLKQVATVDLPAIQRFVAEEHFKVHDKGNPFISHPDYVSKEFRQLRVANIEENIPACTLKAYDVFSLGDAVPDALILAELGDHAQTSMAHLWELLKRQPKGKPGGQLLTNGNNIFYQMGTDSNIWVVCARYSNGWDLDARSIKYISERLLPGDRVFSR